MPLFFTPAHEWNPGNPHSGAWVTLETNQMKWFLPGPGLPSVTREPTPKTKSPDLPPGMTRER